MNHKKYDKKMLKRFERKIFRKLHGLIRKTSEKHGLIRKTSEKY